MKRFILLLVSISFCLSQVIDINTHLPNLPNLPIVGEKTIPAPSPPQPLQAEKTVPAPPPQPLQAEKTTVAQPLVATRVVQAEKVTVPEPLMVAGKVTAERLEATRPINVLVPSAPERGEIITPSIPQVVVGGQGRQGREPNIDVITPQGQPRESIRRDRQVGGRGNIQPPNRAPRQWTIRAVNDTWVPAYLLVMPGDQITWVWGEEEAPMIQQQQVLPLVQQEQPLKVTTPPPQEELPLKVSAPPTQEELPLKVSAPPPQEELPLKVSAPPPQEGLPLHITTPPPIQEPTRDYVPIPGREIQKRKEGRDIGRDMQRLTAIEGLTQGTAALLRDTRLHNVVSVKDGTSLEHNRNGFYSGPPSRRGNYTHIFASSGVYWYMCEVHPNNQRGVIVVTDVPEDASGVLEQPMLPLLITAILAVVAFNRNFF